MLISSRIKLRAIYETDLVSIASWRSDADVYQFFYEYLPISVRQQREWYEKQLSDSSQINFVVARLDDSAVGTVSIYNIDRRNRRAEWGRLIIGDANARTGGIGTDVEALILQYAFEHLNIHKLCCEVLSSNSKVVDLHRKFGFKEEGVLREHAFKSGRYVDVVAMAMFEEDYIRESQSGRLATILSRMTERK